VPRVTALVLGAVADDLDQLSLGDGEVHRLISVVMLCSLLLRRALYPASCARCGLRSFRASSKLSPMPAPGLLAAVIILSSGAPSCTLFQSRSIAGQSIATGPGARNRARHADLSFGAVQTT
jgi:hypothetical protein